MILADLSYMHNRLNLTRFVIIKHENPSISMLFGRNARLLALNGYLTPWIM
jgi:hypothetical protein